MFPRILFWLVALLLASKPVNAAGLADRSAIPSPDGQFAVTFSDRQSFAIHDTRGAMVVSSRNLPRFRDVAEFRPEHFLWSPDSQILAIAGGGGHDLETFVLVRRRNSFLPITVPNLTDRYDNPFVTPVKWLKGRRLVLNISGPHAGKANGYSYRGRATIHISMTPPACEVLYKQISEHNDRNGASAPRTALRHGPCP
jgi:hypothetical protein